MDPAAQGSFIPKQALTAQSRGSAVGLLFLIALLIFVMSIVAAGGAFAYERLLNKSITEKDQSLRLAEGAFDARSIQDLVRMDARLTESRSLLQKHVSAFAFFSFLSGVTLERVQFKGLDLLIKPEGGAAITLSGVADSFSSVALQSDKLGSSKVLRDVIFSGITVNEGGKVSFTVNGSVDPSLLLYSTSPTQPATPATTPTL